MTWLHMLNITINVKQMLESRVSALANLILFESESVAQLVNRSDMLCSLMCAGGPGLIPGANELVSISPGR